MQHATLPTPLSLTINAVSPTPRLAICPLLLACFPGTALSVLLLCCHGPPEATRHEILPLRLPSIRRGGGAVSVSRMQARACA